MATFVKPPSIKETEWLRQRFQRPIFLSNNINLVASTPYQPAVASVTITGPYDATGSGRHAQPPPRLHVPSGEASPKRPAARAGSCRRWPAAPTGGR